MSSTQLPVDNERQQSERHSDQLRHERRRVRERGRGPQGPSGRRHRQGHVGPRPHHRGRPLLREALHALAAPALVHRGLRLHRGRPPVGRPGHVHRRGAPVPCVRVLRVLHRRGPRHGGAPPLRHRRTAQGGAALPDDADLGRGEARRLLGPLLPRGLQFRRGRDRGAAQPAPLRRQQGLGDDVRRHPPRVRGGPAQGPARTSRPWSAA